MPTQPSDEDPSDVSTDVREDPSNASTDVRAEEHSIATNFDIIVN